MPLPQTPQSHIHVLNLEACPPKKIFIFNCLQGGPGCASMFGMLYELGPDSVQPDLRLKKNPGAWNFASGLLFMDQPIGTGFSPAGGPFCPLLGLIEELYISDRS